MVEFDKEHSAAWLELMWAYQSFRQKLYAWAKEANQVKYRDLSMELGACETWDLHRRMLVTDFLRSTEMWDETAILLAYKELTAAALQEQQEVAGYARMALAKLRNRPERLTIADEVFLLAAAEEKQKEPDPDVFHNGCMLLYDLGCEAHFSRFAGQYGILIEQAYGLNQEDFARMKEALCYCTQKS